MKNIFNFIIVLVLSGALSLNSCTENKTAEAKATADSCCSVKVSGDSLLKAWNQAWNTHDSAALGAMFADDAIMIEKDWVVKSKDSIMAKWIHYSLPSISNLTTENKQECNCCCCISMTGLYSCDYTSKKGTGREKGNYTFIWNQGEDKSWKLKVVHLHVF